MNKFSHQLSAIIIHGSFIYSCAYNMVKHNCRPTKRFFNNIKLLCKSIPCGALSPAALTVELTNHT